MMFSLIFVEGLKSAEGGTNSLADMDADLDRGSKNPLEHRP